MKGERCCRLRGLSVWGCSGGWCFILEMREQECYRFIGGWAFEDGRRVCFSFYK